MIRFFEVKKETEDERQKVFSGKVFRQEKKLKFREVFCLKY